MRTEDVQFLSTGATLFHLRQAIDNIHREIRSDAPFARKNDERRAEIDQLRDMIDRRT